jgi:penicillin-binding protein 1A
MLRLFRRIVLAGILLGAALAGYLLWSLPGLSQLEKVASHLELVIRKQGEQIELRQAITNISVPLSELPAHLRDALLTMEDRRFYEHWGIDYRGIGRAVLHALEGRRESGGSTITQQLAKNLFLSPRRTLWRKLNEALLALKLEVYYSKDELLELYLNSIYFGRGANGIESAARRFFGKRSRELGLWESALLVGSLPSPENWNVESDPEAAAARAELVLEAMRAAGTLPESAQVPRRVERGDREWHRVDHVALLDSMREELLRHTAGRDGEMVVITTIDPELQLYAELAVRRNLDSDGARAVSQGALLALGPDGAVRAIVTTADRSLSTMNHVTQTRRQLGSVFKPIVYLAALENGWKPEDRISGGRLDIDGWAPRNWSGDYPAELTLTEALVSSQNTAAVRLQEALGRQRVIELARRLGMGARLPDEPGLALGIGESTLMDVTSVYGVFASGGERSTPYQVHGIRAPSGRILYWRRPEVPRRVAALSHVTELNRMLAEAVYRGTGKNAAIPTHRVAGKTGTTQDSRDAWFVGYSAYLTAGVWVGNDDNTVMPGVSGSGLPARIWRNFMANAHESEQLEPQPLAGGVR